MGKMCDRDVGCISKELLNDSTCAGSHWRLALNAMEMRDVRKPDAWENAHHFARQVYGITNQKANS